MNKPLVFVIVAMLASTNVLAQQIPDPDFDASVKQKTYQAEHPRVVIDEAHFNFHTAGERYRPLAQLLTNDGYDVAPNTSKLDEDALKAVRVLIIANARSADAIDTASGSAFTDRECDAVRDWVRAGGSLLLIADHTPFGDAAANLARRFDIEMGKGYAFDLNNFETAPTILVYTAEQNMLGEHPAIHGRNDAESVQRVVAFAGQSLSIPSGAFALMILSPTAYEANAQEYLRAAQQAARGALPGSTIPNGRSVAGRAQGVALTFGKGRVVVLGEAGMFSAQILKGGETQADFKFGMNAPDNDDRQFALNTLHWLSGLF